MAIFNSYVSSPEGNVSGLGVFTWGWVWHGLPHDPFQDKPPAGLVTMSAMGKEDQFRAKTPS